jgi:hypothetical protein
MLALERPDSKLYVLASIGPVARRIRHRPTEPGVAGASLPGPFAHTQPDTIGKQTTHCRVHVCLCSVFFRTCSTKQECSCPCFYLAMLCVLIRVGTGGYFEFRFHCSDLAAGQDKASVVHRTHCAVAALSLTSKYKRFLRSTDSVEMQRVCSPEELPRCIWAAPHHRLCIISLFVEHRQCFYSSVAERHSCKPKVMGPTPPWELSPKQTVNCYCLSQVNKIVCVCVCSFVVVVPPPQRLRIRLYGTDWLFHFGRHGCVAQWYDSRSACETSRAQFPEQPTLWLS